MVLGGGGLGEVIRSLTLLNETVVQSLSCVQLFVTPWTTVYQVPLLSTVSQSLLKFMSIELVIHVHWVEWVSNSSSTTLFFCLPSFPASESFPMSWLFTLGGQSIGASASASVLPMNFQGWFPLALIGVISLLSKGLSRVFSSCTVLKHQFFGAHPSLWFNSHSCMNTGKNTTLTVKIFVSKDLCWQSDVSTF